MPASMINADTGGSTKVAGSSIEIVATGPMPGSTPMSVPSITPMKQYITFCRVSATPNPMYKFCRISMGLSLTAAERDGRTDRFDVRAERNRQLEPEHEHSRAEDHQADGKEERRAHLEVLAVAHAGDEHQQDPGDDHAH